MPALSERTRTLEPSRTIAMNQRARDLAASGLDIADLTVGEPDFHPPENVRAAAARAIAEGADRYTPVAGYPELREAVSRKLLRENGLSYPASQVMVSCGAKSCLSNAVQALVGPGDEAIIPVPAWSTYAEIVKLAGGVPVLLPTTAAEGYKLRPERLEAALTPRTRLLILCTPSNPTGAVFTRPELEALAAVLERFPETWVLSDEVYERIRYVPEVPSPAAIPSLAGRCVTVNGLSKSHAMTGWRIGFLAGPRPLVDACIALQGQTTTCASSISQKASLAALETEPAVIDAFVAAFARRRERAAAVLRSIPGVSLVDPDGAFYLFPDLSAYLGLLWKGRKISSSDDLALFLLEEARAAFVPGSAFGPDAGGCVRISFAASDERIDAALGRTKATLEGLRAGAFA